jgi:hypothetical protein
MICRGLLGLGLTLGVAGHADSPARPQLMLCGWDEVFILALPVEPGSAPETVWSWKAEEDPGVPAELRRAFRTTDDVKAVDSGRRILISSSSGGIALVDRATRRATFCARVVNAHSIEWLPGGRIAAAASVGSAPGANRVVVFDSLRGREVAEAPLPSAHGLVWEEAAGRLWALGFDQLQAYALEDTSGGLSLRLVQSFPLPDPDGHDLVAEPGGRGLLLTTHAQVWRFDRDRQDFTPFAPLAGRARVKSVSVHPKTGRLAAVQAEGENWWSEQVLFPGEEPPALRLPGRRLYKARWLP